MLLANEDMIIHTEKYVFFLKKDKTKRSPRKRLHKEKKKNSAQALALSTRSGS